MYSYFILSGPTDSLTVSNKEQIKHIYKNIKIWLQHSPSIHQYQPHCSYCLFTPSAFSRCSPFLLLFVPTIFFSLPWNTVYSTLSIQDSQLLWRTITPIPLPWRHLFKGIFPIFSFKFTYLMYVFVCQFTV